MDGKEPGKGASGHAVRDAVAESLDTIARLNPSLRAVITVADEAARAEAERLDAEALRGRRGLLHGMPMLVKDNIETQGLLTTSGSTFFSQHIPNHDAPVVQRLRAAGAVILGKATLHEFAFGIRSNNSVSGQCRNPWNVERVPGGSSGGSAAALAAGMCVGALGTDTGGSVRLPAAMCGVSGLRPTVGRVPNTGCTPVSPSQDAIGPMARSVEEVALILAVIAGYDAGDPYSVRAESGRPEALGNFLPRLGDGVSGLRIGIPRNYYYDDVDPEVAASVAEAAHVLEQAGAELLDVDVAGVEDIHHWATVVVYADACAFHAERLAAAPEKFDPQVYERMKLGLDFTAVDYSRAMLARAEWRRSLARTFADVDLLLTPAVHTPTPPIEDGRSLHDATRAATRNTYAGAFAQIPGLCVPCGFSSEGMPIGVQLEAAWWQEPVLLRAGCAFQRLTDWHLRTPPAPTKAG